MEFMPRFRNNIIFFLILHVQLKSALHMDNNIFYNQGQSVRSSIRDSQVLFIKLGRLELTYRALTFRYYSFSSQVPCEKRRNSIINTGRPYVHFKHDEFVIFNSMMEAGQSCRMILKLGMMIPVTIRLTVKSVSPP